MSESVWRLPFAGTNIAVIAHCQLADGAALPEALAPRLQGADLIVTLGRMGGRSALDQLAEIAPVLGVQRTGDPDDIRTRRTTLTLEGDGYRVGCVSDAIAAGLADDVDPFIPASDCEDACQRLFGGRVDILLHATSPNADEARLSPQLTVLSPGTPVERSAVSQPSLLRLKVGVEGCYGQLIWVA